MICHGTILSGMVDHSRLVHLNFRRCSSVWLITNVGTHSVHAASAHRVVVQGEIIFASIECSCHGEDVLSVVLDECWMITIGGSINWRTRGLSLTLDIGSLVLASLVRGFLL